MYIKKLEYLQKKFKDEYLYSGVTTKSIQSLQIGTPCIINLNVLSGKKLASDLKKLLEENRIEDHFKNEAAHAEILFLFNTHNEYQDVIISDTKLSKVCRIEDKPLIYDSYNSTILNSSKKNNISNNIVDKLKEQLKNNRFVNYVFEDVKLSNVSNVISDIKEVVSTLIKNYKNNLSFYYYVYSGARVLIDTVSISFYKIKDVIPVFNYRKSDGVCMEITMTNSESKGESLIKEGHSMTYRFLFAKYNENIFYIDGSPVNRPNDYNTTDTLSMSYKLLKKFVPIDVSKSKSKTITTKEHKEVREVISDSVEY